jgi:hypothetical protein
MPAWKVLFTMVFALVCFALTLSCIIVPMTIEESGPRWLWLAGLVFATIFMGTLFTLYLRSADRTFIANYRR